MSGAEVTFDVDSSAFERVLADAAQAWLQRQLSEVASTAFHNCPVSTPQPIHPMSSAPQRQPGRLQHSINTRIEGSFPKLTGRVVANAPYAYFVHEGTNPHPIFPKRPAYALAFWQESAGAFQVRSSVFHPGTEAQPFLRNALDAVMGD